MGGRCGGGFCASGRCGGFKAAAVVVVGVVVDGFMDGGCLVVVGVGVVVVVFEVGGGVGVVLVLVGVGVAIVGVVFIIDIVFFYVTDAVFVIKGVSMSSVTHLFMVSSLIESIGSELISMFSNSRVMTHKHSKVHFGVHQF